MAVFDGGDAAKRHPVQSLFDVEDETVMPHVRDMTVGPVSTKDVQEFAQRYHYMGSGGSQLWRWGLWHGPVLHGVVAYNMPTRSVCETVFGAEHAEKVWHMGRLILSEESPRNSESRLIGGSLQAIERDYPHVWAVLTYAATSAGHIGTVYQATNALYTGTGGENFHWFDADGAIRSTYSSDLSRSERRERAERLGWTRRNDGVKHRYIYILGNKTQRRQRRKLMNFDVLPYPKKEQND
jgi:hypothetical protein